MTDSNLTPRTSNTPDKAVPPAPMPRDKQGWRVAPAPDGRGHARGAQAAAAAPAGVGFWIFFVVLLALNWLSVLVFQPSGAAAGHGAVQPVLPHRRSRRVR